MNYLTLFEGKTLYNELWPLLGLRAELDLRLKNYNFNLMIMSTKHSQRFSMYVLLKTDHNRDKNI